MNIRSRDMRTPLITPVTITFIIVLFIAEVPITFILDRLLLWCLESRWLKKKKSIQNKSNRHLSYEKNSDKRHRYWSNQRSSHVSASNIHRCGADYFYSGS